MKITEARHIARKAAKFWIGNLGLGYWDVEFEYHAHHFLESPYTPLTCGYCETDWKYLRATVHVSDPVLCTLEEKDIERFVVHELCHALVNEMRDYEEGDLSHEERVCSMLTNAFMWTKNSGTKNAGGKK